MVLDAIEMARWSRGTRLEGPRCHRTHPRPRQNRTLQERRRHLKRPRFRAALGRVHWHNTNRLHNYLTNIPPTKFQNTFYTTKQADQTLIEIQ